MTSFGVEAHIEKNEQSNQYEQQQQSKQQEDDGPEGEVAGKGTERIVRTLEGFVEEYHLVSF